MSVVRQASLTPRMLCFALDQHPATSAAIKRLIFDTRAVRCCFLPAAPAVSKWNTSVLTYHYSCN